MHKIVIVRKVRRIAVGAGVAAALAMPLAPAVYRWLHPPTPPIPADHALGALALLFNTFMAMGDGIAVYVWILGLALTAVIASLVALVAAWLAREPRRTIWLCGLPVLLVVIVYGMLVAVEA